MDMVVQQNASSSEELAATAEELAAQSTKLVETVGYFKTAEASSSGRGMGPAKAGVAVKEGPKSLEPSPRAKPPTGAQIKQSIKSTGIVPAGDVKDSDFEEF
jgi:methyl-accepting chemotaxis protein